MLPLVGMGVGALVGLGQRGGVSNGTGDFDDAFGRANSVVDGAVTGAFVGMGLCVILDAAAFAWDTKRVEPDSPRIAVSPFGVAGTF